MPNETSSSEKPMRTNSESLFDPLNYTRLFAKIQCLLEFNASLYFNAPLNIFQRKAFARDFKSIPFQNSSRIRHMQPSVSESTMVS